MYMKGSKEAFMTQNLNIAIDPEVQAILLKKVIISAPVLRFSVEKMGLIKQIVSKGLSLKK